MNAFPNAARLQGGETVIAFPTNKVQNPSQELHNQSKRVWPDGLRKYLREQISAAKTAEERADAVRLASELAAR